MTVPPNASVVKALPAAHLYAGLCAWHELHPPRGKTRLKLTIGTPVAGTTLTTTATLTNGFGDVTIATGSVTIGASGVKRTAPEAATATLTRPSPP